MTLAAARQAGIAAEAGVKNAEETLAQLKRMPTAEQLSAAELAVERSRHALFAAQIHLQSAENALARLESPPTEEELIAGEIELATAIGALAAAEANVRVREEALQILENLPTEEQLIAAEVEVQRALTTVAAAATGVEAAEEALARLEEKPTPEELKPAEIDVQRAEASLWALYLARDRVCARDSTTNACNSANAEITKAELSRTVALDRLERVKAGAAPEEFAAATRTLDQARNGLALAQIQQRRAEFSMAKVRAGATAEEIAESTRALELARQSLALAQIRHSKAELSTENLSVGAAPEDVAAAIAAIEMARRSLSLAEAEQTEAELSLERIKAGATPEEIAAAELALSVANAQEDVAKARLAQILEPEDLEIAIEVAEKQVASAKAALDATRASNQQTIDSTETNESDRLDFALQEKQIDLARANLVHLENRLALAQIEAPFSGIIISKDGRDGDLIQPYKSIVGISNPEVLVVAVDLPGSDLAKLELGQPAKLVVTALPTDVYEGEIISIPSLGAVATAGQGPASRTVRITYNGPDTVEVGDLVRVTIEVQKKEDVVIVPSRVVRTFAGRRFVRVVTDTGRRQEIDVKIGISDDEFTEIVSGLEAGQIVMEP